MMKLRRIILTVATVLFPFLLVYAVARSRLKLFLKIPAVLFTCVFSPVWIYSWVMAAAFLFTPSAGFPEVILPAEQQFFVRVTGFEDVVERGGLPFVSRLESAVNEGLASGNAPFDFKRIIDITGRNLCVACRFHGSEDPSVLVLNELKFKYFFFKPLAVHVALPLSGMPYAKSEYQGRTIYETTAGGGVKTFICFLGRTFAYSNDISFLKETVSVYGGLSGGFWHEISADSGGFARKAVETITKSEAGIVWADLSSIPRDSRAWQTIESIFYGIPVHEVAYPFDLSDADKAILRLDWASGVVKADGFIRYNRSGGDPLLYDQLLSSPEYVPDYYKILPANAGILFSTKVAPLNLWDLYKYWGGEGRQKVHPGVPNEIILMYNSMIEAMNNMEKADIHNKLIFAFEPDFTYMVTAEKYEDSEDEYYPALTVAAKCSDPVPVLEIFDGIKTGDLTARETEQIGPYSARKIKVLNEAYGKYLEPAYCVVDNNFFFTTSFSALKKILRIRTGDIKNIYDNKYFSRFGTEPGFDGYGSYFADFRQLKKIMNGMKGFAAAKVVEKIDRPKLRQLLEQEERKRLAAEGKTPGPDFAGNITGLFEKKLKEIEYEAGIEVQKSADFIGKFGGFAMCLRPAAIDRDGYVSSVKIVLSTEE